MKRQDAWKINKSADFTEIEEIDIHLEIDKEGMATAIKDKSHTFVCKPVATSRFLLKRYPFMIVPTLVLSLAFLWLHPIAFFIYALLTILLFTIAVRRCAIKSMNTYIMVFWIIHLLGNFLIMGGILPESLSLNINQKHGTAQALFFGMLLTHIWIYVLIFLQQYYRVFNVIEEEDGEQVSTPWYIWKGCTLCNHKYNPFTDNCGEL